MKDSQDLRVITIGMDKNPGVIGPFMEKDHYTFPVVLAKSLVDDLVPEMAIPRNWMVDKAGTLRQEGVGFSIKEWPEQILSKMQALH